MSSLAYYCIENEPYFLDLLIPKISSFLLVGYTSVYPLKDLTRLFTGHKARVERQTGCFGQTMQTSNQGEGKMKMCWKLQRERSDRETTESPKLDEETASSNIEPKPIW